MSRILIGTSGWSYASWRGPFFPKNVMVKHHLDYYATQFSTPNLNGLSNPPPTSKPCEGGRITHRTTLYSPGRHQNSLRTGNASPINRVTASHCSNRDCAFLGQKSGRSCSSCRHSSSPTAIAWPVF